MKPDDERHGTTAGEQAHRKAGQKPCDECSAANRAYQRRSRQIRGTDCDLQPALGSRRRIEALMALGWSGAIIAERADIDPRFLWRIVHRSRVFGVTAQRISAAYDELSMSLPPTSTKGERISVAKTRGLAARRGWPAPLCWDNIDDPAERPQGRRDYHADYDAKHVVDEVTVLRILAGEVIAANRAERLEVVRRWLASGRSERSLCQRMQWKAGRYIEREEGAA